MTDYYMLNIYRPCPTAVVQAGLRDFGTLAYTFSTNISPLRGFDSCQGHEIWVGKLITQPLKSPLGTIYLETVKVELLQLNNHFIHEKSINYTMGLI